MSNKRLFQVFDEMNVNDEKNKTKLLPCAFTMVEAKTAKGGGYVTMGVEAGIINKLFLGEVQAVLVVFDKKEYHRLADEPIVDKLHEAQQENERLKAKRVNLITAMKEVAGRFSEGNDLYTRDLYNILVNAFLMNMESTEALKEGESNTPALISQDAHEKEVIMQAFSKVRQIFEGREWIMEGRGSYPYNDDRYQEEVRYMYNEFDQLYKDTWHNIKSKSIEYREWIINEYLHKDHPAIHDILTRLGYKRSIDSNTPAPVQGDGDLFGFTEWATGIAFFDDTYRLWEFYEEGKRIGTQFRFTTAELYQVYLKEVGNG